ncbi:MAG: PIN domain-containing protein [Acidiferrobacter sp.]
MIAIDTDVLARLVTRDDKAQALPAKALFDAHIDEDGALFVSSIVLVELCWALERSYQLSRQEIAIVVRALIDNRTVKLESPDAIRTALGYFAMGDAGFPDCLIVAKAGCESCSQILTFDRRMASLPDVRIL